MSTVAFHVQLGTDKQTLVTPIAIISSCRGLWPSVL